MTETNHLQFTAGEQGWRLATLQRRLTCGKPEPIDLLDASVLFYISAADMSSRLFEAQCFVVDSTTAQVNFWVPDSAFTGLGWRGPEEARQSFFCRFWVHYWAVDEWLPVPDGWASATIWREVV